MAQILAKHWPEYLIEGALLGIFMISATLVTALVEHPNSPIHRTVPHRGLRRMLIGLAMGTTAIALIYSPWGQQSGAHFNPATTLAFLRLGKITAEDAMFYIIGQFVGGAAGVLMARALIGELIAHPSVNYVVTVPGTQGIAVAFIAEVAISCGMMFMVLWTSNTPHLARNTGVFAGILVFLYITFEAPYSGMSLNPARTVASALPSGNWTGAWIYFIAPVLGMLLAVEAYCTTFGLSRVRCAKLNHPTDRHCIFCGESELQHDAK